MRICTILVVMLTGCFVARAADAPAPAPAPAVGATAPAVAKAAPSTAPSVTPQARELLDRMDQAYASLISLDLVGKLAFRSDVGGEKRNRDSEFTAKYQAPNRFVQDMKDDVVAGSTGEKLYMYSAAKKGYIIQDAPKGKIIAKDLQPPYDQLLDVISTQNPSLLFALTASPSKMLIENMPSAEKLADVSVDGKSLNALKLKDPATNANMTLLLDPATNLVRRATLDMSPALTKRGAQDVKEAQVTVDYSTVAPGAAVKAGQFAWAPPADAKDVAKEMAAPEGEEPSKALEGKAAPEFSAKDLNDKQVALKDFKGKVVIVDFWATWCGPCREGLPHVDKVYQAFKDKGVVALAVDVQETKEKVQQFVTENKFTFTALLDSDGKVSEKFKVSGIPQTVIIGKDGIVKNVFVGTGPDSEKKLHDAVQAAVDAK